MMIGCAVFSLAAQNNPPVISNVVALADTVLHKLHIRFEVHDDEGDFIEIFLGVSSDGGSSFDQDTRNATGDIGHFILQGQGKEIEWYYPDSLSKKVNDLVVRLTATDVVAADIQHIVSQIDSGRLKQNLLMLQGIRHRNTGLPHLLAVQDSLVARFQELGLQTRVQQFAHGSYTAKNIIGVKSGTGSRAVFFVTGHYDTVDDSPGADDNASAIAGILEIIRILQPLQTAHAVGFIAFDLEETGLLGSKEFVQNGILPQEDVAGIINMDMIGYYSERPNSQSVPAGFEVVFPDLYAQLVANQFAANFIISTANTASAALLQQFDSVAALYVPDLLVGFIQVPGNGEFIPDSRRSDHAPFWDAGFGALHLSDGAETRNPNYHAPTDVDTAVHFTFMRKVTMAVAAMVLHLARPLHATSVIVSVAVNPYSHSGSHIPDCMIRLSAGPGGGYLHLDSGFCQDDVRLRIFSSAGMLMQDVRLRLSSATIRYVLNDFPSGLYLVEIVSSKRFWHQKVLVE
ncbi:MAG: hypothetical protein KatS3mg031_0017 [Chitinophagales bacterium]|nr:MAG: hypothetical protein KatS3mg031_0017 [Chitinophagales bacterium]